MPARAPRARGSRMHPFPDEADAKLLASAEHHRSGRHLAPPDRVGDLATAEAVGCHEKRRTRVARYRREGREEGRVGFPSKRLDIGGSLICAAASCPEKALSDVRAPTATHGQVAADPEEPGGNVVRRPPGRE